MKIRIGYELEFNCPQPTPMILSLRVHASRVPDLAEPDDIAAKPPIPLVDYVDSYGNRCTRLVAPSGILRLSANAVIDDSGLADTMNPAAQQSPVEDLPDEVLLYLLGSRYCETDPLADTAWRVCGHYTTGWDRVQAICDFVHHHIEFGYHHARPTRTALEAMQEKQGVCRDFSHLAIALCRSMNIPARYCTGYLSDIGIPPPYGEMDFAAWFEAWLDGQWYIFDPRNNERRIGRILIARGRDAADVAISTSFGPNVLQSFKVYTDEIIERQPDRSRQQASSAPLF